MIYQDLINLTLRRWQIILVTIIVMLGGTVVYAMKKAAVPFETTIFINIGTKINEPNSTNNNYYNVQAADAFTETVQGWLKNPEFINEIGDNIDSRKQEKQNLIVSYTSATEYDAHQVAQRLNNLVTTKLNAYNQSTGANFIMALFTENTSNKTTGTTIYLILAIILGLTVGFGLAFIYETIFDKTIFKQTLETIFGKKALTIQKKSAPSPQELIYLKSLLKNHPQHQNAALIGIDFNPSKTAYELESTGIIFPDQIDKIDSHKKYLLLIKMGTSTISSIIKTKQLLQNDQEYIIIER